MRFSRSQPFSLALVILGFALPAFLYARLPGEFPVHWNWYGDVDAYAHKPVGPFLVPAVTLLVYLLMLIVPVISPREFSDEPFRRIYDKVTLMTVGFMFFISVLVLLVAIGMPVPFNRAILSGLGILLVALGWLMPKFRRNRIAGIRTPWTLANEEVWTRTHRFGGKLLAAAGAFVVLSALASPSLLPAIIAVSTAFLLPMAYSLVLHFRIGKPDRRA